MKRALIALSVFASLCLASAAFAGTQATIMIHIPDQTVYSCPRIDCDQLFTVKAGEKIDILEVESGWAKITAKGGTGWLQRDYIYEK